MPATLDEFKLAFAVKLSDELFARRDEQAVAALKALKKSVESLKDGDAAKRYNAGLRELVRRYDVAKKQADRPKSEIAADFEGIRRAVITILSDLKRAATSSSNSAATSAGTTAGNGKPAGVPAQSDDAGKTSAAPAKTESEVVEDRRRDLKKARAAWVAVKTRAEEDLEKVKDGARREYMADADQFPKVAQGCKAIDEILDNLDDELRDTLDQYVSTPVKNQNKLISLAADANSILDRYLKFVAGDPLMKAIDKKEFADVAVHGPVMKALKDLKQALA